MKKICSGCGQERDSEQDYNWKKTDRGVRHTRCKFCISQKSKEHYEKNKQSYMTRIHARDARLRLDNQRKLAEYLTNHPCIDCGQADKRTLEFDHVRGEKRESIARMIQNNCSWSSIATEIAKCDVRCANCHRIKTGEQGNSWRHFFSTLNERLSATERTPKAMHTARRRIEAQQQLYLYLSDPCIDCGFSDIRVLELDHVRDKKHQSIAELVTRGASWKFILDEIAKCEVRCANCHRIKTMERASWWKTNHIEQIEASTFPVNEELP